MSAGPAATPLPEGISIGHFSDFEGLTGCTVVLAPKGVTASVDIRGGAAGTLDTALLSPYASVSEVHAVLLTGGSAPGLGAAAGVSRFLKEGGYGYRTPYARVPLVTGAVIYDLGLGSASACPGAEQGYSAAAAAGESTAEGSVGAGTGATVGKFLGEGGAMKGGIALASLRVGGVATVWALTVVNALGNVLAEDGSILAGARRDGAFVGVGDLISGSGIAPRFSALESTTISVIITDARCDKRKCAVIARMAHDGLARAIDPVHAPMDGDCVFVLATGPARASVFQLGAAAAEVAAQSIRRAARLARGLGGVASWGDLVGPEARLAVPDSGRASRGREGRARS